MKSALSLRISVEIIRFRSGEGVKHVLSNQSAVSFHSFLNEKYISCEVFTIEGVLSETLLDQRKMEKERNWRESVSNAWNVIKGNLSFIWLFSVSLTLADLVR